MTTATQAMADAGNGATTTTTTTTPPATTTTTATDPAAFAWPETHKDLAAKYQNDPVKVIGALADAQKFIGADKATLLQMPKEGDTEAQGAFWNKLGRPEKSDGYTIPKELATDATIQAARAVAHENGLSDKQFGAFTKWFQEAGVAAQKAADDAFSADADKAMAELKTEWAAGFDRQVQAAKAVTEKLGLKGDQVEAIERALGTKTMMSLFAKAGATLVEQPAADGGSRTNAGVLTPAQARDEIRILGKDRDFGTKLRAGDREAKRRMDQLNAWAAGMTEAEYMAAKGTPGGGFVKVQAA